MLALFLFLIPIQARRASEWFVRLLTNVNTPTSLQACAIRGRTTRLRFGLVLHVSRTDSMSLFEKLAAKERNFRQREFLSPVLRGSNVCVRIDGVIMSLKVIKPNNFHGWGVFHPVDFNSAKLTREPTMKQRKEYLALFPSVRLVVCRKKNRKLFGAPLSTTDARFGLSRDTLIALPEKCELFDTIVARFDGQRYWFEQHDRQTARKLAQTLRQNLRDNITPELVCFDGSNQTHRDVYEYALLKKMINKRDPDEVRLQKALAHGGGKYVSHRDLGDHFSVAFEVDGEHFHSTVRRNDLQIQSAGICLDGYDASFDLQSLVGVMREGQNIGAIYRG